MRVLIAGVPVTGKSTLRRLLIKEIPEASQHDADNFTEERNLLDAIRKDNKGHIQIIEDVRAIAGDFAGYDKVVYVYPSWIFYMIFCASRSLRWFLSGKIAWERNKGWCGSGNPKDVRNIPVIISKLWHFVKNRQKWIKNDLTGLERHSKNFITKPIWLGWNRGVGFPDLKEIIRFILL